MNESPKQATILTRCVLVLHKDQEFNEQIIMKVKKASIST